MDGIHEWEAKVMADMFRYAWSWKRLCISLALDADTKVETVIEQMRAHHRE